MNRYLVNMIFRIQSATERVAQFDEQLQLVQAQSPAEAYEKSLLRALTEEGPVKNVNGSVLEWKFVGITSLKKIEELSDSTEIFSNTRETGLPQAYVDHVKEKQEALILSLNQYSKPQVRGHQKNNKGGNVSIPVCIS